jgi:DNA polymerase-3 subunit beta
MVATDGHRLAYAGKPHAMNGSKPVRVLVPRKAVSEIARLMEGSESVSFSQTANHLVFTAAGRMLACKMIEGQFPAWEKVLKAAGTKTVDLKTAQLAATMRRVSLLASERGRTAKLTLQPGLLEVVASCPDVGSAEEELPIEYTGEPVSIGLNAQYILDFCRVAGADVKLALKDAEAQATFTASGGGIDYVYVVMPMRL